MLAQEKVPGGKLICIEAEIRDGRIEKIKITGDFFLHPEDTIEKIEHSLLGKGLDDNLAGSIARILSENNAQLIGATADDLERLVRKAML